MTGPLTIGLTLIPTSLLGEAAFFGTITAMALLPKRSRAGGLFPSRLQAAPTVAMIVIVAVAVTTHVLRDHRERQLRAATWLLEEQGAYGEALALLDKAECWPSPAKLGRLDYLHAGVLMGLGDREGAEWRYLRSLEADPDYFWLLADLAAFYASADLPREQRARLAHPYVQRLRSEFRAHPLLSAELSRIDDTLRAGR
jgi:hypothetical protein